MTDEQLEPFVTAGEIARRTGLDERWIRRHAESGDLPAYRLAGSWRFRASEVLAWIERNRRGPFDGTR